VACPRWALCVAVVVTVVAFARTVGAQSTVIISVQSETGPLADALVTLVNARLHARTDSSGVARFPIAVPAGRDSVSVRRLGYNRRTLAVVVPTRDTLRVSVSLESRAVRLSGIEVKELATLSWFEEFDKRRARGQGRFITRDEIDREHGSELGNIITRRFPGVKVSGKTLFSTRGPQNLQGQRCTIAVYIDGFRERFGNIAEIPVGLIGAVEYYTPSIIPVQYKEAASIGGTGSPACGVLLLWTR
jgi:hypothetical protein